MTKFRCLAVILGLALLCGCSGSADNTGKQTSPLFPGVVPSLSVLGSPVDATKVLATECANPVDPANTGAASIARYPKSVGTFRGWPSSGANAALDYASPLQMRADQSGGFVVSHATKLSGAMFQIAADGAKSLLPLPYASVFDVAPDGRIWFALGSTLAVGTKDGKYNTLAALGAGKISAIAAGQNTIYVLSEEGELRLDATPVSTLSRTLTVISRPSSNVDVWTPKSMPWFSDLNSLDVVSAMRVGPADELYVLLNKPFAKVIAELELWPGAKALTYQGTASVRVASTTGTWRTLATQNFVTSSSPNYTHGYTSFAYDLDVKDLSVAPNGNVWVGGAGALYAVDATTGWTLVDTPAQKPQDVLGQDGDLLNASFASATQLVAGNAEVFFYDGEICQIRKFKDKLLTTFSGPMLAGVNFASAGFIGQDLTGDLLFSYGNDFDNLSKTISGRYQTRSSLAKVKLNDNAFTPIKLKSLAASTGPMVCTASASYWVFSGCAGAPINSSLNATHWLGQPEPGQLLRREGANIYTDFANGASTLTSSTLGFPGVLNGDAPSGPSGVHVEAHQMFLFGWVRTDPPVQMPAAYHELRIYKVDLSTGRATAIAGATAPMGSKTDLSPLIPTAGGGPAFIQHRGDGSFWLSNGKEIWFLDTTGKIQRIAGLASTVLATDGIGSTSSFGLISNIRLLTDKRLMVIDQGAHAIRVVSTDGKVETLVGKLNQPGSYTGPLPALLESPSDAFVVGRDVYISSMRSRQLLRASSVF